jgi:hypothetical protein
MASNSGSQPLTPGLTSHQYNTASVSATPSTLQGSQGFRSQSEMKGRMEDEIKDATYVVDLTNENGILRADRRIVENVIKDLQTTFQALTSGGNSSATDPRLPRDPFSSEPQSYKPLSHLLNKIITTANPYISQSLHQENYIWLVVTFSAYWSYCLVQDDLSYRFLTSPTKSSVRIGKNFKSDTN